MSKTKLKTILLVILIIAATFLYSVEEQNTMDIPAPGLGSMDGEGFFICWCFLGNNCGCILGPNGGGINPSPNPSD